MSTILLQGCDGAAKVLKCSCESNAVTNWQDVVQVTLSTFFICVALVLVAFCAKCAILSWKSKEIEANQEERKFKKQRDEEESMRKQMNDLLGKKLDFLQKLCYTEEERVEIKDGKETKVMVQKLLPSGSDEVNQYLSKLDEAIQQCS